ncbi:MAG TPA: error-prone DNA polymerase [Thermoanaerobaculia bacterium]|nr:error-prone DNA polymerase [Thermoanaerobaculia bacterium]
MSCEYDHLPHVEQVLGPKENERRTAKPRATARPYAELRAASAFSFLDAASLPEDLVDGAARRDVPAMALVDTNGVYGAPRFYGAAKKAGIKALVGAELLLQSASPDAERSEAEGPPAQRPGAVGACPERNRGAARVNRATGNERIARSGGGSFAADAAQDMRRATLLVENREGYKNLCKLITAGAAGREKGKARFTWQLIEQYAEGLHCLTRDDDETVKTLAGIFKNRTHIELQRHSIREEEHHNQRLIALARRLKLPLVATNGVRYARAEDKPLHDVLTCIREGQHVDNAGRLLGVNRQRHIKGADEMLALFRDIPRAVSNAWELSERLDFTLANLGYQFPQYPLPPGESDMSFLRKIAWNGATARFRPLTAKAQAQISKELAMIEKLDLAGYFLIVWDIVRFCQREKIMVQGRGSAANSAVCYALSITAVDPVKMELLFERFLSEERGEWPDIDLDLPSGDQREKVIQHVYKTYGAHGAAMTANVITYRDRSAAREVGKALGFSLEQADKLSKCVGTYHFGEIRETFGEMAGQLAATGFDPEDLRVQHFMRLQLHIQNLPRHLGQHSGGMVMARGRLDEVVPLEPASMPGRVVIQWDKDDCADLGIIKVDLLGLGMLQALEEAIPLIREKEGVDVDLAHLPPDDPAVYKMLNEADTVGMFQVESRAQMASLPRNAPEHFYDIVVQVAIIRPGPIVGGMIRPFFDRRQGKAPVEYPHPCLEPILKRTLGVPLFQEQLLRIAMVAANFTGGEAEELRRAMGFKRSMERMHDIEGRLRAGMTNNKIDAAAQDQIVKSITSFALYGFPESHAASFALIAYASAYIKARHPAAFYISLLNAWPMGFYHPATLIKDAQRHGVRVLPVDVNHSGWRCRWENGAVRLGLRFVKGLREQTGKAIEAAQPFRSADDLALRAFLRGDQLTKLACAGALASLGLRRRAALWQAAQAARPAGELFESVRTGSNRSGRLKPAPTQSPLHEMSRGDETLADYDSMQLTTGPHLIQYFRTQLKRDHVLSARDLKDIPNGRRVTTAGAVIVRQRPGTAKGFVFLTLEDETGMSQAIIHPNLFRDHRSLIVSAPGLIVEGILQNTEGQCSVKAERFWPLDGMSEMASHDFH